jgi:ADP-heptose:LPS heptosyltransferase
MKILAIQFRYLGDAALMTPALRALKDHFPGAALHVLVAKEAVPLLQHLPWLEQVWAFPRTRGKARLAESWPVLQALRRQRFDRSVDFSGNDRSALISLACGARQRLAAARPGGFFGRRLCYTQTLVLPRGGHQALSNLQLLAAWGIAVPEAPELEIRADPALAGAAEQLFPRPAILCHIATSQPKKEWPVASWAELYRQATAAGHELAFSTGVTPREQALLEQLKKLAPNAPVLPVLPDLATFLAVIGRAGLFVCGDTGPLHFAAGLGVPTIGIFGPSSARVWAPLGGRHRVAQATDCTCGGDTAVCLRANPCLATLSPETVFGLVSQALAAVPGTEAPSAGRC